MKIGELNVNNTNKIDKTHNDINMYSSIYNRLFAPSCNSILAKSK